MVDRNGLDGAPRQPTLLPNRYLLITHDRVFSRGKAGKIGPDHPVEQVFLDATKGFGQSMNHDGFIDTLKNAINQQRQKCHMIKVGVGEKNVPDSRHLIKGQIPDTAARINQYVVINQQRRGSQSLADTAITSQNS